MKGNLSPRAVSLNLAVPDVWLSIQPQIPVAR